jgi:hypothetical protein
MVDTNFISAPAQGLLTLTTTGGAALNIMAGWILAVKAKGSGATVWYDIAQTAVSQDVTASAATVVSGLPFILVTPADGTGQIYVPVNLITTPIAAQGGTSLRMSENYRGLSHQGILVTESVSAIQAAITAALAASSPGSGAPASVTAAGTTQGTATATTARIVRITGGGADTGIVLDGATLGERTVITNATTTRKFYYPASGENFTGMADNIGMTLQPNQTVELFCSLATEWSRVKDVNTQSVTGSGTVQGGGAIAANTEVVYLTTAIGNTAGTLPAATVDKRIRVVNVGSAVGRLFPTGAETINGGAASAVYQLGAGRTCVLVCNTAGAWVDETSQINSLAVNTLYTTTAAGTIAFTDPVVGAIASMSTSTGIVFSQSLYLYLNAAAANPGGTQAAGTPVTANIFNVETCATDGDSVLIATNGNFTFIKNSGVADCWAYCPVGHTMDGVTDGYFVIPPGETWVTYMAVANTWLSFPAGEAAQSLTATPGGVQADSVKVRGSVVTLATVATALDGATIDPTSGVKEFVIFNNAGVSASLFPPVGGSIDGGAQDAAFTVPRSCAFILTTTNGLDYRVYLLPGATQVATANAGSTQATGTAIVGPFVNCTAVVTAGDAYTIKNYSPRRFVIWNRHATNALDLFPTVGGTVNGGAVDAAFSIPAGVGFAVSSIDGSAWLVELLPDSVQSATASAGSDQATGTPVVSPSVNCTTVATAGDSYTIQTYSPTAFAIRNSDATESLDLFPPVGGTINGGAVDAAFAIAAGSGFNVKSNDGVTWLVELLPGATQGSTANVGSTQGTGTPVVSPGVECLVCANPGDAYTIQTYSPRFFHFRNSGAQASDLFPPSGGQINGGGADIALSVAAAAAYIVYSNDGVLWYAILQ